MKKKRKATYFFVRGFMRSGTNWIGNVLNLHPDICCNGEYHFHRLFEGFNRISNPVFSPYGLLMKSHLRLPAIREFERFVKRLIELGSSELNKPDATILGARTPCPVRQNVIRRAKRIHIIRDGRDCLVSSAFHFLRLDEEVYPFGAHPDMIEKRKQFKQNPDLFKEQPDLLLDDEQWVRGRVQQWVHRVKNDRKFIERRQGLVYCTKYERLHAETEEVRREMYEFLGADPDKADPLDDQTSAGFDKENVLSHYRKGTIGDWKKYFNSNVRQWFQDEAKDTLLITGYEKNDDWVRTS